MLDANDKLKSLMNDKIKKLDEKARQKSIGIVKMLDDNLK